LNVIKSINRTNDYAFKRIMGSEEGKEALISFLNAVLKPTPGKELTFVELLAGETALEPATSLSELSAEARLETVARRLPMAVFFESRLAWSDCRRWTGRLAMATVRLTMAWKSSENLLSPVKASGEMPIKFSPKTRALNCLIGRAGP